MAEVVVVGSESYTGAYSNINTALGTTIGSVTLVVTADNTQAGTWAQTWATTNGVPFIDLGQILPGIGYNLFRAPLAAMYWTTPSNVLLCGTHARVTAASGAAAALGHTITAI
jgi:hypothetical protein